VTLPVPAAAGPPRETNDWTLYCFVVCILAQRIRKTPQLPFERMRRPLVALDQYVGGIEHAILLLFRFFTRCFARQGPAQFR